MKENEARDVLGMMRAATSNATMDGGNIDYWVTQLQSLDAEIATKAVLLGVGKWKFFPSWAEFFEIYSYEKHKVNPTGPPAAASSCPTCGGDKFVVVSLRKPATTDWMRQHKIEAPQDEFIEETAPCYTCNSGADTSFWRPDGTEARGLDPARVEQLHRG
jgi:hypothetical protein